MAAAQKVSFTIRRPTPVSRAPSSGPDSDASPSFKVPSLPRRLHDSTPASPLARSATSSPKPDVYYNPDPDSSDDDEYDRLQDELVTGFDKFGVQRLHREKKARQSPLVIPALKNRDWRELARKRRSAAQYVPPSAKAETGTDGSVGGLGVKDSINSGPMLSGLQIKPKIQQEDDVLDDVSLNKEDIKMEEEETDDQKALRAILAGTSGAENDGPMIDIIPTPISEADAYKQDVEELPDVATLEDYARVPVSQFGAALLRGMGWKEGTAASRKPGKGMVEPYLPEARPALLGIGAKEREILDDGSKTKNGANKRPERRYVPVVKKARDDTPGSGSGERDSRRKSTSPRRGNSSATASRRNSRSPDRSRHHDDRRRDPGRRERDYDYDRDRSRRRDEVDKDHSDRRRDRSRESSSRKRRDY